MASPADAALGAIKSVIPILLIAGIATLALKFFARRFFDSLRAERGTDFRYVAVRNVASAPEKVLYDRLCKALPELTVLAQVHLPRVVQPASRSLAPLNKIIRKSLDFVICDATFVPLVAIEVNDKSHQAGDRIASDIDKAAALKSAGIPLIKWEARKLPTVEVIRRTVLEHVKLERREPEVPPQPKSAVPRS